MEINISGAFNDNYRRVNLAIQVIATGQITPTNLKLRIAVTEQQLYYGGRYFQNVFRDMIPNTAGIGFTISQGDTAEFNQSFTLSSALVVNNCEIIVFVQSDNGRSILQGDRIGVADLPLAYELDPFSLLSPTPGDTIRTCFPYCVWEPSDDPDSGYAVSYEVMIDLSPVFPNPILSGQLADTTWLSQVCLINDTTYYWKVRAFNGHAPDIYSDEVWFFKILEYGAIRGTVYDDSADVLEGAVVQISGLGRSDTTDALGGFSFLDLERGSYDLEFSLTGFRDSILTDVSVVSAETTLIEMILPAYNCQYVAGDANGSGSANGLDVTYLVSYFKGGSAPLDTCLCDPHGQFFPAADANGSCSVNGLDVTYLVSYFKGSGEILFCADCPPLQ
jgi:hypothetical protein